MPAVAPQEFAIVPTRPEYEGLVTWVARMAHEGKLCFQAFDANGEWHQWYRRLDEEDAAVDAIVETSPEDLELGCIGMGSQNLLSLCEVRVD